MFRFKKGFNQMFLPIYSLVKVTIHSFIGKKLEEGDTRDGRKNVIDFYKSKKER